MRGMGGALNFFLECSSLVYIWAVFKPVASTIKLCFKPWKAFERSVSSEFEYSPKFWKLIKMGKFSEDH